MNRSAWIWVPAALLACLAPASATAADPPARPALISPEDFAAWPFLSSPSISPDGLHLVAGSTIGGKKAVVLADLTKPDYGLSKVGVPDDLEFIWARWAGNNRVVMSLLVPGKIYGIEFHSSRLLLYDLTTHELKVLADKVGGFDGDNVIYVDPAGEYLLLSAQRSIFDTPAVLRVDFSTLKSTQVVAARAGVWSWYADRNGVVRGGLGTEGNRWWLLYREGPDADFRKIAKSKRQEQESQTDVEKLYIVPGSDKGYVIANRTTGRFGVYHYDFVANAMGDPVFEHPEVDVDDVDFSPRTGELDAVSYVDDRERFFWLDPTMKAIQARIDKALPGYTNRIVSRDAADQVMLVWSGGGSDPGAYYVFNRKKGELRELARPYASLDGKQLAEVQPVRYAARDGLSIPAYLTLPVGREPKGLPLVILPHGGPFLRDKWEYDAWVQFLANRGYAVLQPNFRGSTGYGKTYVDAASGQFGRKMQDDLDDGVLWLTGRGIADPKRVCIMGGSYGGYAAMWAAARNPDLYRCAISFAGISDVSSMLRYDRSLMVASRYYRDWRDRIRGDSKFDLDNVSPLDHAADIRIPMLIAHGKDDTTVPMSQSVKLHEALERAGRPHEYVLYPDEPHGFRKPEDAADFLKRVGAFLAKYNPAG